MTSNPVSHLDIHSADESMRYQTFRDMAIRSCSGPAILMTFFCIFVLVTPLYEDYPRFIGILGSVLIFVGTIRTINEYGFNKFYTANPDRWIFLFDILTSATALIWGIFCVFAIISYGVNEVSLLLLVSTAGISAGALFTLIPCRGLAKIYQSFLLLPTAIYCLFLDIEQAYTISFLFLLFLVYMTIMTKKLYLQYWEAMENARTLENRVEEFEVAKDKAIELIKTKDNFLTSISHEIRTPMNGIMGMAQILQNTKMDDEQSEYVEAILKSNRKLVNLVNDILDFSKLNSGQLVLVSKPFNLENLLEEIADLYKQKARDNNNGFSINIDENCPTSLQGDKTRVKQILMSVVSNAIKFTRNGTVEVNIFGKILETNLAEITFQVKDTGVGIAPDYKNRIFESFTQGDSSFTRNFGGTGLGLTIAKEITEAMGGTISYESKLHKGSTFKIRVAFTLADKNVNI